MNDTVIKDGKEYRRIASIKKYKGEREKFIHWLVTLPTSRVTNYEKKIVMGEVKKNNYVLWTATSGLKILR